MIKHYYLKIYGQVQGVNFRHNLNKLAQELKISGWVRNELDGSLSIEMEGDAENLQKMIIYCYRGPARAKVNEVKIIERKELEYYSNFKILY